MRLLLFLAAIAGLFSIVPLAAWAATGRWRAAVEAAKGYGRAMGLLLVLAAVIAVLLLIAGAA